MNGRKAHSWKQLSHAHPGGRWIAVSTMLALCMLFPGSLPIAHAQESGNRITNISVTPDGELIFEVEGEGFDPMLRLESAANGEYRILVQGEGVTISPEVRQEMYHLSQNLRGQVPAIDLAMIAPGKTPSEGFKLILTAWRKLQPQVSINNGSQIVIKLIGDHTAPQAVLLQRQHLEQQRIAALKRQEALKKQAELQKQIALQHQARLKRQAEAALQAKLQREAEQQRLAELKRQDAQRLAEQHRLAELQKEKTAQELAHIRQTPAQQISEKPSATKLPQQIAASQPEAQQSEAIASEPDDDFAALKRQEAQRLAEQQRQALAHRNQLNRVQPDEAALSLQPIESVSAIPTQEQFAPGGTTTKQAATTLKPKKASSSKLGNSPTKPKATAKSEVAQATSAPSPKPLTPQKTKTGAKTAMQSANPRAEWQRVAIAQKPLTPDEFIAELQVAQRTGNPAGSQNLTQEISPANNTTRVYGDEQPSKQSPSPSTQQEIPATQSGQQPTAPEPNVPVHFNGPIGAPIDDSTPVDPIRLKKLPSNYTPEPDPDAPPVESPSNPQRVPGKGESPTNGAKGHSLNSIYAVINQPNADPSLKQAWQALTQGQPKTAQTLLHQHLQRNPKDVNARYLLAEILLSPLSAKMGASAEQASQDLATRRKEAQRQLLTNYDQSLHWPSCQLLLEMFIDDGQLQEAQGLLKQVQKAYPHEAGVHYEQGRLQEALGNLDAARTAYQTTLSLQPDNPETHYRLAQVELKANHLEAARWELLQALSWSPNDSRLHKLLGYIADRTGQSEQAAQAYRQALPLDALLNYARALEAQHQPERAMSLYQAVETLAGDNGDIIYNLAMIYKSSHRPTRASAMLQRFLSLNGSPQDNRIAKAKSLLQELDSQK